MRQEKLLELAYKARENAYAPYSHFLVGAALLCGSGTVYSGCNIENASFTPSNCAERTAFFKAISEGETEFIKIAIVGAKEGAVEKNKCLPCGVCLQVMQEFCDPLDFQIIVEDDKKITAYSLMELLPHAFTL